MTLNEITHSVIQDFAEERWAEVQPSTAQRDISTLRAILNKSYREGKLAAVPPFPRRRKENARCRWLTRNEEQRLLDAAAPHLKPLIAFAVDTGARRGELFKLDWRTVNLERGFVTFLKTKNGEDRSVRLTERAKLILQEIGPKSEGPVFTYKGKPMTDIKHSFDRARLKAGIEDLRFHDLRHTFASRLVQQGISLYEVMHLTGHKTVSMVQRYAHLAPDFQEKAIDALNTFGTNWSHSAEGRMDESRVSA